MHCQNTGWSNTDEMVCWQAILLSDSSSDEEDGEEVSEAELHDMLRLHRYQRKHQMTFYQEPEVRLKYSFFIELAPKASPFLAPSDIL